MFLSFGLLFVWEKAMLTTKEKLLLLAKFHCQIIVQILMNDMDQHRKRYVSFELLFIWISLDNDKHVPSLQINMSTETERRVENLLAKSIGTSGIIGSNSTSSPTSSQGSKQSLPNMVTTNGESTAQLGVPKEKFSLELRDMQISKKVYAKLPMAFDTLLTLCFTSSNCIQLCIIN